MRKCSPVTVLYVEKPHHCLESSKFLQPKIYVRSFYDLLLLLGTEKMACVLFLLYFNLLIREKSDICFTIHLCISFNRFNSVN